MAQQPDRALRRLIAKIADLGEADRTAVLDGLSTAQATEVARLLNGYHGTPVTDARGAWSGLGLSPALIQRLETGEGDLGVPGAGQGPVALSLQTLSVLRRLASDLEPARPSAPPAAPRPGLLTRLGLLGWRP